MSDPAGRFTPSGSSGRLLHLVAVELDPEHRPLLHALGAQLRTRLGVTPLERPALRVPPEWRGADAGTLQSNPLVDALVEAAEDEPGRDQTDWTLALTSADLVAPGRPFVFGEATLNGPCAVVSLARLDDRATGGTGDRLERRLLVEALHEIGHLLGLAHCDSPRCVMHPSATPADIDRKGPESCGRCGAWPQRAP